MTAPKEYAEDFTDGTEKLPPEVRAYMGEQRAFWRQVRGDDGPVDHASDLREIEREAALRTGYADWIGMPPDPEAEDPEEEV